MPLVNNTHPINPQSTSPICRNCEHALSRHTQTGTGNGPNGVNSYRCNICGPSSGTHYPGWREGMTEPRQSMVPRS